MIQVSSLSKSYGSRTLLDEIDFTISKGERVGLVGRNGCGKSTLFKIILKEEDYDSGSLSTPKNYSLGHLSQHIHFTENTVIEECALALGEDEKWDLYKAEKILFGLGFNQENIYLNPNQFSGGFQLRINFTKTLLRQPDMLLLDEPTNYLDLPSLRWLRGFLLSYAGEVVIITHDKLFMDTVTTHTMGIHRGKLLKIPGNTEKYYDKVAEEEEIYEKTRQKQEKKVKHLKSFVDRFGAQAAKATQAQSKMKEIAKLEIGAKLQNEADMRLRFQYEEIQAKRLLEIKDLSFAFAENEILFQDLNFEVMKKDRIGIIGRNGKGKTTLLNVISNELQKRSGEIKFHDSVRFAYYQQTNKKKLDLNKSIYDEISAANPLLTISQAKSICGAMMFSGDDSNKKIKVLSGGEQGRVLLGKILAKPSNFLFLDEPTNHLDMYSIDIMIEELRNFPGSLMIVTHSEELLKKVCNKLIVFQDGKAELFNFGYNTFLEKIGWQEEEELSKPKKKEKAKSSSESAKKAPNKKLKKELAKLEEEISKLEESLKEKNQRLLEWTTQNKDFEKINELSMEIKTIEEKINTHFQKLEEKSQDF